MEPIVTRSTRRVKRSCHLFESTGDRREKLVADVVSVSVVDALEIVEVQQQHRTEVLVVANFRLSWESRSSNSTRFASPIRQVVGGLGVALDWAVSLRSAVMSALGDDEVRRAS